MLALTKEQKGTDEFWSNLLEKDQDQTKSQLQAEIENINPSNGKSCYFFELPQKNGWKFSESEMEAYLADSRKSSGDIAAFSVSPRYYKDKPPFSGDKKALEKGTFLHDAIEYSSKHELGFCAQTVIEYANSFTVQPSFAMNKKDTIKDGISFYERICTDAENQAAKEAAALMGENIFTSTKGLKNHFYKLKEYCSKNIVSQAAYDAAQGLAKDIAYMEQHTPETVKMISACYSELNLTNKYYKFRPDLIGFKKDIGANVYLSIKSVGDMKRAKYQIKDLYIKKDSAYIEALQQVTGEKFILAYWLIPTKAPFHSKIVFTDCTETVEKIKPCFSKLVDFMQGKKIEKPKRSNKFGFEIW